MSSYTPVGWANDETHPLSQANMKTLDQGLVDLAVPDVVTFTPVLTATVTDPTRQTSGANTKGTYRRVGGQVYVWIHLHFGDTGIRGEGIYEVDLPVAADTSVYEGLTGRGAGSVMGSAHIRSAGEGYTASPQLSDHTLPPKLRLLLPVASGFVEHNNPAPFASGDRINLNLVYVPAP